VSGSTNFKIAAYCNGERLFYNYNRTKLMPSPYTQIYGHRWSKKQPVAAIPKPIPAVQHVVFDLEVYRNYFLAAFLHISTGNSIYTMMGGYTTIGFNSTNYDIPMLLCALRGMSCEELKVVSDDIILTGKRHWQTYRKYGLEARDDWQTIDLVEPTPAVMVGLKTYGARMHSHTIQDLPYPPELRLTVWQMNDVRDYCANDLKLTGELYQEIKPRLDLREKIGKQYGINVMSKSDPQVAEAIFEKELPKWFKADPLPDDYTLRYVAPDFIKFQTTELIERLALFTEHLYTLDKGGKIKLPPRMKAIKIDGVSYKCGVGGLHSQEKSRSIIPASDEFLIDSDVTSYYPNIIRQLNLYPLHLSEAFKSVYSGIIDKRVAAKQRVAELKAAGDNHAELSVQETLMGSYKLSLNGSFGKFGSPYSALYSPELLLATTVTGQLALLMLIERLSLAGFRTVSANTDGIQILVPKNKYDEFDWIIFEWEADTGFTMEYLFYSAVYSRDVNNYVGITTSGEVKNKGVFAPTGLMKTPAGEIIQDAVRDYLTDDTPLADTIRSCTDIRKFILSRNCTGGATWRGEVIGKTLRWVWTTDGDPFLSVKKGAKVANSTGAYPVMTLPDTLPDTLDYDKYIAAAKELLALVGGVGDE